MGASPFTAQRRGRAWARAAARRCTPICSAIQDALGDSDRIVYDSHNPWERVWSLVHSGERGEPRRHAGDLAMIIENEFTVGAEIDTVWRTLLDMEGVATCLPGATITTTPTRRRTSITARCG